MHLFCPIECSLLPDPNFCCHILSSAFIYCLLSIYTIVWRDAICHFPPHFPSLYGWVPFFFSFKWLCFNSSVTDCTLQSVPDCLGPLSSLPCPFWCFMCLRLALLGFLSYSSHWTSLKKFLPQQTCGFSFSFSSRRVLRALVDTQYRILMARVACT